MRLPIILLAAFLAIPAAQAQSVPPSARSSDSWSAPASASTTIYREGGPRLERKSPSHFKFKERRSTAELPGNAAQEHSGNAPVGGMGTMDRNGRPQVDCPQTPMDPACH